MNMRNLLKPGDFISLIPLGIQLTLQYNADGNIERVYTGFGANRIDRSSELRNVMVNNRTVPLSVHIKKGTSWVRGVLYTSHLVEGVGNLPFAVQESLIKLYLEKPSQFNFFAVAFESTVTHFQGPTPTRHALSMSKFKLLPGWLVPGVVNDNIVNGWLNNPIYTFHKIVTDYAIYHKGEIRYVSAGLKQFVATKVVKYTDDNGFVKGRIHRAAGESPICVDYSDAVTFNIQPNTMLIMNSENQLIYSKATDDKKREKRPRTLTCKHCGKAYQVPMSGPVQCPDSHCPSKMVPIISQFFSRLKMTVPEVATMRSWLDDKKILCIPDILLLPEYQGIEIETTLGNMLRALVPVSVIPRDDVFILFANACNNNPKTFRYYTANPALITADLGLNHTDLPRLLNWLTDNCNASDIDSLLNAPQFQFKDKDKRFDGPPIFRNKVIYLTGEFIRGNSAEISAILQSYSARVTLQFSPDVHCVLIGGKNENINGAAISSAKNLGIAVMQEEAFFKYYEIDEDLKANLVYTQ